MKKQINIDLEGKILLFDSNFIINSQGRSRILSDLLDETMNCGAEIVSLPVIQLEIYKGSDTYEHIKQKTDFFNKYVSRFCPIDDKMILAAKNITAAYRKLGANIDTNDILLGAYLKLNPEKSYLITSNFKDFPTTIFDWTQVISVTKNDREILNVVILKFSQTKFVKIIDQLMKTKSR